ncbi:hypothetical protein TrLO_g4377 [Triparma laevis f. longispina]|uniref:Uncharacterized protein n=1 Tax=Triparma laevis f. longispina TaxID=1714387 RepID=A0A9W7EDZ8_9STRA|nr:hypothetical protein TrLO_g4377 [Triparma laevis f. longispina]
MSALSRFPSNSRPDRKPLNDVNVNGTPTRVSNQLEKAFIVNSRSAIKAKLNQASVSLKKKRPSLNMASLPHPMVKRVHDESDLLSPPLASVKMFREKSQEREQTKPLPPRNFTDISNPNSRASSRVSSPMHGNPNLKPMNLPSAVLSPSPSRPARPNTTFNSNIMSQHDMSHENEHSLTNSDSCSPTAQAIFDRLDRIEKELDAESDNDGEGSSSEVASTPKPDLSKFIVPIAPPSAEMREYAYKLMMSPEAAPAPKRSPLKLVQNTPTPIKLAMDADCVNIGSASPSKSTSPLGAGVDKILAEGLPVSPSKPQQSSRVLFAATESMSTQTKAAIAVASFSVAYAVLKTFF